MSAIPGVSTCAGAGSNRPANCGAVADSELPVRGAGSQATAARSTVQNLSESESIAPVDRVLGPIPFRFALYLGDLGDQNYQC